MKAYKTQLPTNLLIGRDARQLRAKRGQMPRSEAADANQAAIGKAFE